MQHLCTSVFLHQRSSQLSAICTRPDVTPEDSRVVPTGVSGGSEDNFASPCVEDVCVSSLVYKYHYIHILYIYYTHIYTVLLRFQLCMWCLLILHHDCNYLVTYIFCTWRSISVCWYAQDAGDRWLGFPGWISSHATGLANFGSGVLGMVQFLAGKKHLTLLGFYGYLATTACRMYIKGAILSYYCYFIFAWLSWDCLRSLKKHVQPFGYGFFCWHVCCVLHASFFVPASLDSLLRCHCTQRGLEHHFCIAYLNFWLMW